jgi:hypothetical protein
MAHVITGRAKQGAVSRIGIIVFPLKLMVLKGNKRISPYLELT